MYIQTKDLSYIYSKGSEAQYRALAEINIEIQKGSWTAIIGPTGSGKSTFIQHLNGILKPTRGKLFFEGRDINAKGFSIQELRSKVGMVFQYPEHQLFETTVFDEVAFGPRNLGLAEQEMEATVKDALSLVGLDFELFRGRAPLQLSGGEKRKVAIASILAMKPQVLVFDEATAGLDPKSRTNLVSMIDHLRNKLGITVIWVTHNLNEAWSQADCVFVFHKGRVVLEGKPDAVFDKRGYLEEIGLGIPQLLELENRLKSKGFKPDKPFHNLQVAKDQIMVFLRGR